MILALFHQPFFQYCASQALLQLSLLSPNRPPQIRKSYHVMLLRENFLGFSVALPNRTSRAPCVGKRTVVAGTCVDQANSCEHNRSVCISELPRHRTGPLLAPPAFVQCS